MKSLGDMLRQWCMRHGLEYITFYVKKRMAYMVVCSGPLPVLDQALGAPALVRIAYKGPHLYIFFYQILACMLIQR